MCSFGGTPTHSSKSHWETLEWPPTLVSSAVFALQKPILPFLRARTLKALSSLLCLFGSSPPLHSPLPPRPTPSLNVKIKRKRSRAYAQLNDGWILIQQLSDPGSTYRHALERSKNGRAWIRNHLSARFLVS